MVGARAEIPRPAVWGFFVCAILVGMMFVAWYIEQSSLESAWALNKETSAQRIEGVVTSAFREKVDGLIEVSEKVKRNPSVLEQLRGRGEHATVEAFNGLGRQRPGEEYTIDIVDPRGTIVAWAGRSIAASYENFVPRNGRDSFAVILQSGLHTYLSVGVAADKKDFYVITSRPLELQYPISNRFVNRVSFAEELSDQLNTEVWIALNRTSHVHLHRETRYVLLKDFDSRTIGYVFYSPETLSALLHRLQLYWTKWISGVIGIGLVFFGALIWKFIRAWGNPSWRLLVASILIWTVRIGWRMLGFPSALIGGQLFDSTLYASPFYFGLTSSIGEMFLSTLALSCHMMLFWYFLGNMHFGRKGNQDSVSKKALSAIGIAGVLLLFLWSVRGYAEAFRTFVFDSTLHYHDPSLVLPETPVVVMHVSILLLTISLLLALLIVLRFVRTAWSGVFPRELPWWTIPAIVFVLDLIVFVWIDSPIRFPVYFPVLVFSIGVVFSEWIDKTFNASHAHAGRVWKSLPVLIVLSIAISTPLLDNKLHEKERQQVETYAENLVRPVDSWLSYVLIEGLRTAWVQFPILSLEPTGERNEAMAFSLWAQTLMSREGYNSALVLYDKTGGEMSRFTVGMTTFDQKEMLTKLFDGEEEVVQVTDRVTADGPIKLYGVWSMIRGENRQIVGSVALLLTASQRALFRGTSSEVLRTEAGPTFESIAREVAVSEFHNGSLVYTTIEGWYRGMTVPDRVRDQISGSGQRFIWLNERIGEKEFENLYAAREGPEGRIVVVSLEALDLRWHIFNVVKIFFVYAVILLVLAVLRWGVLWRSHQLPSLGFREKLVTAFGILGLIPLIILGYYNREVAAERVRESVRNTLSSDLDRVAQRILSVTFDEEDFRKGVNIDFCEGIAQELGVDFAVYRRSELQSSSKPELYQSAILDSRLPGGVFANVVLLEKSFYGETDMVGRVEYAVGYKPLYINDRLMGVLSVPALYRHREIDEELAQRNAFVFGVYALAFGLILITSFILANRLSRPIRELTNAAMDVGRGDLDVTLKPLSTDEIGNLTRTFNTMVHELKRSRDELKRAERESAWKEMAKQVAHEIRNPLTPMKLSVQHLRQAFKDKVRSREAILQEVTKTIIEQIDTLSRIASEFSNFARMPERRFERINVHALLREGISLFKDVRGIEFRTIFPDNDTHIVADGEELRRVFVNLLRNSVQAMWKGGVITVEAQQLGNRCVIRIADTGRGIPPEIQQRVFEPNFSTKTDGMGLGLAISQKTIQDLGGSISFKSEMGKGTTFEITLPV